MFHELNLQLECSIAATQKAVFVTLTLCASVCEFVFLCIYCHYHLLSDSD